MSSVILKAGEIAFRYASRQDRWSYCCAAGLSAEPALGLVEALAADFG